MNYMDQYNIWKQDLFFDEITRKELASLDLNINKKEIEDCFCCDLEFGTNGLRGIMGVGSNRINKYTVGRATQGLGNYLIDTYGMDACVKRGVVIGYDTRNNSHYLAQKTADVLSGMGIRVYLHSHARPTPQLSFTVKFWNAVAGVVITTSHDSREYNGYKVYDEFGCQLVPNVAKKVGAYVNAITDYRTINFKGNSRLVEMADVTDNYISAALKQSRFADKDAKEKLHVVYTPLHGTGNVPIQKTLRLAGFINVESVEEQVKPDGDFPTIVAPNPNDRNALLMGVLQAERSRADIVLGTDMDSGCVGVAVQTERGYSLLTSDQISILLIDYVLDNTDLTLYKNPAIVKTVVASELGVEIARKKGVTVFTTLSGFQFIGEKITQFEQAKMNNDIAHQFDFVLGYDESCGYLVGIHARDKDAVVSSLLICEMTAKLKAEGKTLIERMNEIYAEYGYRCDDFCNL